MNNKYLIIIYWVLLILSVVIDVGFGEYVMPEILNDYMNDIENFQSNIAAILLFILSFIFSIYGTYGILRNRAWGELYFLIGNALGAIDYLFLGFCIASGIGGFLISCYTLVAGMIISKIFFQRLYNPYIE